MQLLTYIVYFDMFSSYDPFDNTCHIFLWVRFSIIHLVMQTSRSPSILFHSPSSWTSIIYIYIYIHYQKIDEYKRKYRGNISVGKFPRDFTDGNIPSVYTEGITVGKKLKQSKKKMMTCHFYQRNYWQKFHR